MLEIIYFSLLAIILLYEIYNIYFIVKLNDLKKRYINIDIGIVICISLVNSFKLNYVSINIISAITIVVIFIKIISLYIYTNRKFILENKKIFIALISIICVLFAIVTISIKNLNLDYGLKEINNSYVQEIINKPMNDDIIVYIGRPTCNSCVQMMPKIEEIAKDYKLSVMYYNTDVAREEDESLMLENLTKLDIKIVPTILIKQKNENISVFKGNNMDSEFKEFIQKNY
ncbi:MAG: thioredoxin family protein [Romboutsia sp.]